MYAHYTNGSKRRPATLTITATPALSVFDETINVSDKREARRIANERGAKPWNF